MPEETTITEAIGTEQAPITDSPVVDPAIQEMADAFGIKAPKEETAPEIPENDGTQGTPEGEPEEHKLQSWLGRKLAARDKELEQRFQTQLEETMQKLISQIRPVEPTPKVEEPSLGFDPDEVVTTKGEVFELLQKAQQHRAAVQTNFVNGYKTAIIGLMRDNKLDPDTAAEVGKALDATGNPVVHREASVCAQLNFHKALNSVLMGKMSKKEEPIVPVSGKPPTSSPAVSVSSKTDVAPQPTVNLDAEAARIAAAFNLTPERAQAILKAK